MIDQSLTLLTAPGAGAAEAAELPLDDALVHLTEVLAAVEAACARSGLPVALAQQRRTVYAAMDALGSRINGFLAARPPADQIEAERAPVTNLLRAWSRTGPFFDRAYGKLRGYPGDYETLEIIYNNRPGGADLRARILDDYYLHTLTACAIRHRPEYLADRLGQSVRAWAAQGVAPVRVLGLGCGPARELALLAAGPDFDVAIAVSCLDQDAEALRRARHHLADRLNGRVTYLRVNPLRFARGPHRPGQPHHVIYAAGLLDALEDDCAAPLLQDCYDLLAPGGQLIMGNLSSVLPANERVLFDWLLEWPLVCRGEAAWRKLFARTLFPPAGLRFEQGPTAFNLFVRAERP